METQLRSPVFRPLYSPYRIEQYGACTVLPRLEPFLRDESRTAPPYLLSLATFCRACPLWVISRHFAMRERCPLLLQ